MRRNPVAAFAVAIGILCLIAAGVSQAAVSNVYWRVDLHQGSYIIAYGQGSTEQAAWDDCYRLQGITRAMTATETRRNAVAAITSPVVRWCQNPKRYATVAPDPVAPPPVNCVVSEWSSWSDPPWLACADGMQSRTIIHTRTIVTQPANGGTACPSLVETQAQTRVCPGTATLNWTPPTRNTDGTSLTNLAGYWIHYGLSATEMTQTRQLANPGASRHTLSNLAPGTYYFAVSAYTSAGAESSDSNVVSKVVQ